jgi:hypothetical protein
LWEGRTFAESFGTLHRYRKNVRYMLKVKKKSGPATCHGGLWEERRYSSYFFLVLAVDAGEWSASRPGRALPPGKGAQYLLYWRPAGPQSRSGCRG